MTGKEIVLKWLGPAVTTYDYPAVYKEMNVLIDSIDAAIAAEREACAVVCDTHGKTVPKYDSCELNGFRRAYEIAAAAIRARRQP
jgi:hypothetical protein